MKAKTKIDAEQFKAWMNAKNLSLRKFAAALAIDPSTMTYILKGKRAIKNNEFEAMANILGVPISDILRAAGVDVPSSSGRKVPLVGHFDGDVVKATDAAEHLPAPPDVPDDAVGILCRTAMSRSEVLDGWQLFIAPRRQTNNEILNRLCLLWPTSGNTLIAYVKRGYRPGAYNVQPLIGDRIENIEVDTFAPILWIRP